MRGRHAVLSLLNASVSISYQWDHIFTSPQCTCPMHILSNLSSVLGFFFFSFSRAGSLLQSTGFSSCFSSCSTQGMWDLSSSTLVPCIGIEPLFPALEGRVLTTDSPEQSVSRAYSHCASFPRVVFCSAFVFPVQVHPLVVVALLSPLIWS